MMLMLNQEEGIEMKKGGFKLSEVSEVICKISESESDKFVLIGGQALNFWAELYLDNKRDLAPLASKDIDFLVNGSETDLIKMKEGFEGKLLLQDNIESVHCAVLIVENFQKKYEIQIDFLSAVHGLRIKDILRKVETVEFHGKKLSILHPVDCLKSRINNLVSFGKTPHSIKQLRIAIKMIKMRIIDLINDGKIRSARNEIKMVFKILKRTRRERQIVFDEFDIDLFNAIPKDERLGADFIQKNYPQMKNALRLVKTVS